LYLQQNNHVAAEKTFKLILQLSASDIEAHFYLANIYDEQKNRETAIKELKTVLQLKPDHHQALNYLGYLYVEQDRDLEEATVLIKKALEIEPNNGAYIDSLGWLFFKQGKLKEAIKELEKAIGLLEDPVIYDHLGEAYFKGKDPQKAKTNWEKALKLDPSLDEVKKKLEGLNKNK
jgi:Tfp pilus assembly protein PilF